MASILSFARRKSASAPLAAKLPWQNQDLAELYRVRDRLAASGLAVDVDSGVSDEGDPWFIYQQSGTDNVVVHIARIDTQIHVVNCVTGSIYVGSSFREVADCMLEDAPLALGNKLKRSSNVVLHPSAFLTAFVAAAVMLVDLIDHNRAEAAETDASGSVPVSYDDEVFGSVDVPDSAKKNGPPHLDDVEGLQRRFQRDNLSQQGNGNLAPGSSAPNHGFSLVDAVTGSVGISLFAVELLRMIQSDGSESSSKLAHLSLQTSDDGASATPAGSQAEAVIHMDTQSGGAGGVVAGQYPIHLDNVDSGHLSIKALAAVEGDGAEENPLTAPDSDDAMGSLPAAWTDDTSSLYGVPARTEGHGTKESASISSINEITDRNAKDPAVPSVNEGAGSAATSSIPTSSPDESVPLAQDKSFDQNKLVVKLLGGDDSSYLTQSIDDLVAFSLGNDLSKTISSDVGADPDASGTSDFVSKSQVPVFSQGDVDILCYKIGESISVEGFVLGEDILTFSDLAEAYNYISNFSIDGSDIVLGDAEHGELRLVGVLGDAPPASDEMTAVTI